MDLRRIQVWFQEAVTHPDGVEAGVRSPAAREALPGGGDASTVVGASAELDAAARLGIYAEMYAIRLREALEEDFPGVRALQGPDRFTDLARGYGTAHPPHHYSLDRYGAGFPRYLEAEVTDLADRGSTVELAQLEWARVDAFHAPWEPELDMATLEEVPPGARERLRLRPSAALHLLTFEHAVAWFLEAVRGGTEAPPPPSPTTQRVAVHRTGTRVGVRELEPTAFHLLETLVGGTTLREALEQVVEHPEVDPDRLAASVGTWFRDWTAAGFFAGLEDAGRS